MSNLDALETKINYKFSDRNLLITALTHVSIWVRYIIWIGRVQISGSNTWEMPYYILL